ncbi:MAG TPA: globin [Acidimicrobiales bacterium]|nr:globin [Acidimicrobiales bacterium]
MGETLYDQVGGQEFFVRLVELFYDAVELDEVLRPMYPEDLSESKHHLTLFLTQYWGGPRTYQAERGHPRLRLRHAPFRVTKRARDAWLAAMTSALDQLRVELTSEQYDELISYFTMAATQLRNV